MADDTQTPVARSALKAGRFDHGVVMDAWGVAARSRELKRGRMEGREYLGEPIVIGRTRAGAVYALRDVCPHRAAKLSAGKLRAEPGGAESLECPYHGWRFRTDGACARIPSLSADNPVDISKIRVRTYALVEAQGVVWIWLSSDPRFDGVPPEPPPVVPSAIGANAGRFFKDLVESLISRWRESRR
jgi:phenylpropionate dioxygenase-like ring-hydroxylating dioxygenase large terminal subunit